MMFSPAVSSFFSGVIAPVDAWTGWMGEGVLVSGLRVGMARVVLVVY